MGGQGQLWFPPWINPAVWLPSKALLGVSGCGTLCSLHGVNEERHPRAKLQGKAQLSWELKWIIPLKWIYSLCRCHTCCAEGELQWEFVFPSFAQCPCPAQTPVGSGGAIRTRGRAGAATAGSVLPCLCPCSQSWQELAPTRLLCLGPQERGDTAGLVSALERWGSAHQDHELGVGSSCSASLELPQFELSFVAGPGQAQEKEELGVGRAGLCPCASPCPGTAPGKL